MGDRFDSDEASEELFIGSFVDVWFYNDFGVPDFTDEIVASN